MDEARTKLQVGILINEKLYPLEWLPELVDLVADAAVEKLKLQETKKELSDEEEFYTTREVAGMIRKSEATVTRHTRRGLMIGSKAGNSWLISKVNYLKYINASNRFR